MGKKRITNNQISLLIVLRPLPNILTAAMTQRIRCISPNIPPTPEVSASKGLNAIKMKDSKVIDIEISKFIMVES